MCFGGGINKKTNMNWDDSKECAYARIAGFVKGGRMLCPGRGVTRLPLCLSAKVPEETRICRVVPLSGGAGSSSTSFSTIGFSREDVYIANIVGCRPSQTAIRRLMRLKCAGPILLEQINAIKPKLIVMLGRHSMNRFLPG